MQFKHIEVFTVKEYNQNREHKGYLPQEGVVINVFQGMSGFNCVAVGYEK